MSVKVGIVVPTLGTRLEYLQRALKSIKNAGDCEVILVGPQNLDVTEFSEFYDKFCVDPKEGLPAAINLGIKKLHPNVEFVGWLGDDDLLSKDSLRHVIELMVRDNSIAAVYGICRYIDDSDSVIGTNKIGQLASTLIGFGPNLIPQPGSLFRRQFFNEVGGVSNEYPLAFDLELFLKLKKKGKLKFINQELASFRWHSDSLTVRQRTDSVSEASEIRKIFLPHFFKRFAVLWEEPVKWATLKAGHFMSNRLQSD